MEFCSKDLTKEIERIIQKDINEVEESDLAKIHRLTLTGKKADETVKDYLISDLKFFKNLTAITFSRFVFSEEECNQLSLLGPFQTIQFDFCQFQTSKLSLKTEKLCFNCCRSLRMDMLKDCEAKEIQIIGFQNPASVIDMNGLGKCGSLEKLALHHYVIHNIKILPEIAPNLKELNVDGSQVSDIELLEGSNIIISKKENFHRADA